MPNANGETDLVRRRFCRWRADALQDSYLVSAAAVVLALSASIALAGEVTGSGANSEQNQGRSWCSFSGLNDDPDASLDGSGPNGPGGKSQSHGQNVKLGLADPHEGNPGLFCNPNRTPFLPSRTGRTDILIGPGDHVGADLPTS